jgi:hypothetical protein
LFLILSVLKNKLRTNLDPHLPLVIGMYHKKFFTLETFPYNATFDAWVGATERYDILA